ncbi:MAG: SAM hydroxide adenosyltransferase, partial [Gammaproteobacteria bacterium]
ARHGSEIESWQITWKPERLSSSFHGRDLYAPVCAMLSNQHGPPGEKFEWTDRHGWPDDLFEVIYIDHFGNVMTGIRAESPQETATIKLRDLEIAHAGTFSDVKPGDIFWYENANGLVEIAVNMGNAAEKLDLAIGDQIEFI